MADLSSKDGLMRSLENPPDDLEDEHSLAVYDLASEEICFLPNSQNYCVSFVDMVDSTGITAKISDHQKIRQYYSTFINTMAILVKNYGAKIVKNAGDALIFYFPELRLSPRSSIQKHTRMLYCDDISS